MAGRLERGDVRLLRMKAPNQERPVVILTRGSSLDFLGWVTVAPITSTVRGVRSGARLEIEDGMKGRCVVNAHNPLTVRKDQLGRRVARLTEARMQAVCAAVAFSPGCDGDWFQAVITPRREEARSARFGRQDLNATVAASRQRTVPLLGFHAQDTDGD